MNDSITGEPPTIRLVTDTLAGSVRDFILNQLKFNHSPVPWDERSEEDQKRLVSDISALVREGISEAVRAIASDGRPVVVGTLKSIAVQGGIKAVVELPRHDPRRHEVMDATGQEVLLVVSGATPFLNEGEAVRIKPDQGDIESYAEQAGDVADAAEDPGHPLHGDLGEAMAQGEEGAAASSDEAETVEGGEAGAETEAGEDEGGWGGDAGEQADTGEVATSDPPRAARSPRKPAARRGGARKPPTNKAMARARRDIAGTH